MNNMTAQPQPESAITLEVIEPSTVVSIDLSAAINVAFEEAHGIAADATERAKQAIAKAIECGGLLLRQKASLPHGAWLPWLAAHCPQISARTARRYMRLADRTHVADLDDAKSLRQAYLATGVLPDAPRVRTPSATTPTIFFVRGLDHFRRWFNRRTEELPLEKWSPEARRVLRNELAWFQKLHDQLAEISTHQLKA